MIRLARSVARRSTYANVMSTIAVVAIVASGTAYAAGVRVTSANVVDRSLTAKDIKANSLTSAEVRNGSLGVVDMSAAARTALAGAAGAPGAAGPAGPQGAAGGVGPVGPAGPTFGARANGTSGTPEFCDDMLLATVPLTLTQPSRVFVAARAGVTSPVGDRVSVDNGFIDARVEIREGATVQASLQQLADVPSMADQRVASDIAGLLDAPGAGIAFPAGSYSVTLEASAQGVTGACGIAPDGITSIGQLSVITLGAGAA